MQGIWDSGTRGWAEYEKAMSGTMDLPAEYVRVSVDWMEVETHKRIYVKVGDNGEWMTYSYAGETEEDARG